MAVAYDTGAYGGGNVLVPSLVWSHVFTASANRAVLVAIAMSTNVTVSSVTVGSDSLSAITNASATVATGEFRVELWGGIVSGTGSQTITVTFSGTATSAIAGAVSASGVDQTTPINNGANDPTATGTPSLPITSNAGDLTVDHVFSAFTSLSAPTQTQSYVQNGSLLRNGQSYGPGTAGPHTHQWTAAGYTNRVAIVGANFKAVAATAGAPRSPVVSWYAVMRAANY